MNELEYYFYNKSERIIHKWENYFHFYEKYFSKYKDKKVKLLEIGVQNGGSLQMWNHYFGNNVSIVGMDIDNSCKILEDENIKIFIGDQNNTNHLRSLIDLYGNFDIIIDDGSHRNEHQINTFKYLFDYLNDDGVYLVEDIHTSYWPNWGGGYKKESSFVNFAKSLVDHINGYAAQPPNCDTKNESLISTYTNNISNIHFVSGMIFFEKNKLKYTPHDIGYLNGNMVIKEMVMSRKEIL